MLRLPPAWKDGVKRVTLPVVKEKAVVSFPLGAQDLRSGFGEGDYHSYLQADMLCNGIPKRIHAVMTVKRDMERTDAPRDNAYAVGPLAAGTFTSVLLEKLSSPSADLTAKVYLPREEFFSAGRPGSV